jgi:hypothetical protein
LLHIAPTTTPAFSSYIDTNLNNIQTNANGSAGFNILRGQGAEYTLATTAPHPNLAQHQNFAPHMQGHHPRVQQTTSQYRGHYESHRHAAANNSSITAFAPNINSQQTYYPPSTMSMYEDQNQAFAPYPQSMTMHVPNQGQEPQYPDPNTAMDEMNPYNPPALDTQPGLNIPGIPELGKDEDEAASPRLRSIPKPDREITKGEDGRFVCNWVGCTEETRTFNRKCEWSKVCFSFSSICPP